MTVSNIKSDTAIQYFYNLLSLLNEYYYVYKLKINFKYKKNFEL